MTRPATGTIIPKTMADGTTAYQLRFRANGRREHVTLHERRGCDCGCGGGWTAATAAVELGNVIARVRVGVWKPAASIAPRPAVASAPTFHEYASYWLTAKQTGAIGDPISTATHSRLLWALRHYLLPQLHHLALTDIDRDRCGALKAQLLAHAAQLQRDLAAGADLRRPDGRRVKALGPSSIRRVLDTLAHILDDAVADGHLEHNPARGKRMRIRVPKPTRTFLELDELAALLDAAAKQDASPAPTLPAPAAGSTSARVAALHHDGHPPHVIADRLGRSPATVSYHLKRLALTPVAPYDGRRALCATLAYAGPRVSELCDLHVGQLRLHDRDGARFAITDAKTDAGIREVQVSPELAEFLIDHLDRLRRAGKRTGPDAWLFPNQRGGRMTRQRAATIVGDAATAATEHLTGRGLPALPHTTPHSLRRTYVSIALLAGDLRWVMGQVGHADSKMTLDVYAQVLQRHERGHGVKFDELVADARERLHGTTMPITTDADDALAQWAATNPEQEDPHGAQ